MAMPSNSSSQKFKKSPASEQKPIYEEILKGKSRVELAVHHPLFTSRILLPTVPIEELYRVIKRVVVLRETGCCLTARSGVGKTAALEMVEAMIKRQMPDLVVFRHDTHNQQIPSIRAFFKHFLTTVGHVEKKGETYDLRERLVNCLVDDARISGRNMILLFVDEAHAMSVQDFNFLKDVYNDLDKQGVQLITVLMGQEPDFTKVIDGLKQAGRLDLIGRFAMRIIPFRPYRDLADLTKILSGIDAAIYPEGSQISWTAFFFPLAYKNGFRVENEAKALLEAIESVAPSGSRRRGFPARQTFLAIRTFMLDNACYDSAELKLPPDAWKEAVRYAQLKQAISIMNGQNKPNVTVEC